MLFISAGREYVRENVSASWTFGRNMWLVWDVMICLPIITRKWVLMKSSQETTAQRELEQTTEATVQRVASEEAFFVTCFKLYYERYNSCVRKRTNKSRIFGNVATAGRRGCSNDRRNLQWHCVKGIPRLRSYKKNCERFLQTKSL